MLFSAALLGYIGILSMLATASPGSGLLGQILLLLPSHVLDWLHAPAYGLLAWLGITRLQRRGWPHLLALAAGSLFALVFGLWTETLQLSVPGRGLEIKDLVTDGLGVAMVGITIVRRSMSVRAPSADKPGLSHSTARLEEPA
jgi:hypothetical protein